MKSSVSSEGVYAKVTRAQEQLCRLSEDITVFCKSQQDLIAHEIDIAGGKQTWVFRGDTPKTPIEFSIRVGEIVHNLRSALDHLVWQLVLANGQVPGPKNEFPIFRDSRPYDKGVKGRLNGVAPKAKSRIKSFQPFQKHGGTGSQLWTLNCLSNIDKHRHVNMAVLYSWAPFAEITDGSGQPNNSPVTGYASKGRLERNKKLAVFNNTDAVMMEFRMSVDFGDPFPARTSKGPSPSDPSDPIEAEFDFVKKHGPTGRPVVDTLRMCLWDVGAVCLSFGINVPLTSR